MVAARGPCVTAQGTNIPGWSRELLLDRPGVVQLDIGENCFPQRGCRVGVPSPVLLWEDVQALCMWHSGMGSAGWDGWVGWAQSLNPNSSGILGGESGALIVQLS